MNELYLLGGAALLLATVGDDEFLDGVADRREVRRRLLAAVRNDEREWPGADREPEDDGGGDSDGERRRGVGSAGRKHP